VIAAGVILIGTLATVIYGVATGVDHWWQLVVMYGIALATIATMIAVDPLRTKARRRPGQPPT